MDEARLKQLRLQGNSSNLKRELLRDALRQPCAHLDELEAMFETVKTRHAAAIADIAKRGLTIRIVKSTSTGKKFRTEIANPCCAIAAKCEAQMISLSRLLSKAGPKPTGPKPGSARDVFGNQLEELLKGDDECEVSAN